MGHTLLYDIGVSMASAPIFGILHADMVVGEGYVENLIKHLEKDTIVCATRIEPPLHPPGKEKIIENFGIEHDQFDETEFFKYIHERKAEFENTTTNGIFAPWIIYKDTFLSVGGHDPIFAPYPYEDSDLFQRLMLNGIRPIQSWDSFVYHFTCRGHRWTEKVGVDSNEYKFYEERARKNYLRKWGAWIQNDENMTPIIPPKFNIAYRVKNCTPSTLYNIEVVCDSIYLDSFDTIGKEYIRNEQINSGFDLKQRVHPIDQESTEDIVIHVSGDNITHNDYFSIMNIPLMLQESKKEIESSNLPVEFETGNLKITCNRYKNRVHELINRKSPKYVKSLWGTY